MRSLITFFVDFARDSRTNGSLPLKSNTVNQYVTHISDWLARANIIDSNGVLRSQHTTFMLHGYKRADAIGNPLRLRQDIPFSYPIFTAAYTLCATQFCRSASLCAGVRAALALGYACSLRPSEYLSFSPGTRSTPLAHQVSSSLSHFWWGTTSHCVTDPHAFPAGTPSHFSSLLDYRKNCQDGQGGTIAIAASLSGDPDCLATLFAFLQAHPPAPATPIFSGFPGGIRADLHIKTVLHATARSLGLDPDRLSVHSSIRSGALYQMDAAPTDVQNSLGQWRSNQGRLAYQRPSLHSADMNTSHLHDASHRPLSFTRLLTTPAAASDSAPASSS